MSHLRSASLLLLIGALVALAGRVPSAHAYGSRAALDLENLQPAPGAGRLFSIDLGRTGTHLSVVPQAVLQYADRPLVVLCNSTCPPRAYVPLVAHRVTADLSLALSLWGRLQLAIAVPAALYQYSDPELQDPSVNQTNRVTMLPDIPVPQPAGIGNVRLHAKVALLPERSRFGLGLSGTLSLPSGDGDSFLGTRLPVFTAQLLGHAEYRRLLIAVNLGGRFGAEEQVLDLPSGIALTYGLGAQLQLLGSEQEDMALYLLSEVYGRSYVRFAAPTDFPHEVLLGLKAAPRRWSVFSGLGATLVPGAGTPNVRFVIGLSYSSKGRSG